MNETTTNRAALTVPVGDKVLGRVIGATGEPLDGQGALAGAPRAAIHAAPPPGPPAPRPNELLETGIKVVDLLAPIPRGGLLDLIAPAGVGKMVLIGELIHNLGQRRGTVAVCAGLEERTYQANDLLRMLEELGVAGQTAVVLWRRDAAPTERPQVLLAALTIAEHFRDAGRDVLFLLDKKLLPTAELAGAAERLQAAGPAITTVLFDLSSDDPNPGPGYSSATAFADTRLFFMYSLARSGHYPAVDPLASTSRLLDPAILAPDHVAVARGVREILRRAEDLALAGTADSASPAPEDAGVPARAARIRLFLTQPMFVAEPFSGRPGEYVPRAATVAGFRALLAGAGDALPEEAFRWQGALDPLLARGQ